MITELGIIDSVMLFVIEYWKPPFPFLYFLLQYFLYPSPVVNWCLHLSRLDRERQWENSNECVLSSAFICSVGQCTIVLLWTNSPSAHFSQVFVAFIQFLLGGGINTHTNVSNERKRVKNKCYLLPNRCILTIFPFVSCSTWSENE